MTNDRTIRDRRATSGLTGDALREEITCTCGAGHGSGEPHMDWCDFLAALPSVGLTLSIQPHQNDGGEG